MSDVLRPYWQRGPVRLYLGEVRSVLSRLPARSVHCVVTSPPYYGLRDYGTGTWEGGRADCDHSNGTVRNDKGSPTLNSGGAREHGAGTAYFKSVCGKCGARRIDEQIGSERYPDCGSLGKEQCGECFVCSMVAVFREVYRILHPYGTLWLNLGDSYAGATPSPNPRRQKSIWPERPRLPQGNLLGMPWRVALALQANGWLLRQDIIWHKPSVMPESVENRCTKAHEYVFLFSKRADYFCDMEAIKEDSIRVGDVPGGFKYADGLGHSKRTLNELEVRANRNKRSVWSVDHERALLDWMLFNDPDTFAKYQLDCLNKGDVWKMASFGYPGAHFATYPPKLIEPMILAGTSARGACVQCGSPWQRVVGRIPLKRERPNDYVKRNGEVGTGNSCANTVAGVETTTIGWYPRCTCDGLPALPRQPPAGQDWAKDKHQAQLDLIYGGGSRNGNDDHHRISGGHQDEDAYQQWLEETTVLCEQSSLIATTPCIVLDPFIGSGTTCVVSTHHGRESVGIDLSEAYLKECAIPRITPTVSQAHLFF